MWMFVSFISMSATVVFIIWGIIAAIRRTGTAKKRIITAGALFALFIVTVSLSPSPDQSEDSSSPRVASSQVTAQPTKAPELSADNEAENKAKAEQEAKASAEKKAKEEAEKKAAEEAAAKAAAEAKKVKQSKLVADIMEQLVPTITDNTAELNSKTYDYLVNHYDLFPAKTAEAKAAAKAEVDPNVTSKHLFKNINPYLSKMVSISGNLVEIQEEETDLGTIAFVHIMDDNFNSITGIYSGSTGDILEGDNVRLRGVPTASYSFANVGGGTTNAIFLTVSTIQKLQ